MARVTGQIAFQAVLDGRVRTPSQLYSELLLAAAVAAHKYYGRPSERFLRRTVERLLPAATELYLNLLRTNAESFVEADRDYRTSFEARLDGRWSKGLRLCELVRIVSLDAGMEYHDRLKDTANAQHMALVKLHARACLISAEILSLLRSGHASGAHARWRALHEVAVIADVLADGDSELSRRYLLYEHVESLKGAKDYNSWAIDLQLDPISERQLKEMDGTVARLCDEFGALRLGTDGLHHCSAQRQRLGSLKKHRALHIGPTIEWPAIRSMRVRRGSPSTSASAVETK